MEDKEIDELINRTAKGVVLQIEAAGIIRGNKSAFQKTEWVLKNYKALKAAESVEGLAARFLKKLDDALQTLAEKDEYYEIIPLYFFERRSSEYIAEYFDISARSVRRNKNRLINTLKIQLFADACIKDILIG